MEERRKISIEKLKPDPVAANPSPNVTFGMIRRVQKRGIDHPLVVRPFDDGYGVLTGAEEYLAAEVSGFERVPCLIRPDLEDDLDAVKVSFRKSPNASAWRTLRAVEMLHDSMGKAKSLGEAAREIATDLDVSEEEARKHLRIRELPRHVKVRLKKPWNLVEKDKSLLSKAGAEKEPTGNIPVDVCEKLARSADFAELAGNRPERAHEVINELLENDLSVREAIQRAEEAAE